MKEALNRILIKLAIVSSNFQCHEEGGWLGGRLHQSLFGNDRLRQLYLCLFVSLMYQAFQPLTPDCTASADTDGEHGSGGRRGYSPGSAGRVWYDIPMLKLAVEVQGAWDGRLCWGYIDLTLGQRSELRVRYSNRGLFVWSVQVAVSSVWEKSQKVWVL